MLSYDFYTIITTITNKITQLGDQIKLAEGKLKLSFPESTKRHTFVIRVVTKLKQNCEVLKLRLENVKAMIDGLKSHFEENELVKNYLKPSQEQQAAKVTAFVPTTSTPFLHSLTTYQKLKESLTMPTQTDDDKLTENKNAFIALSFQIASTLFGYGISVLQIFMQNFPEQMCNFKDDTNYGLKQLDTLKNPFEIFSSLNLSDNFDLDKTNYTPSIQRKFTKLTSFSTLLPFGSTKIENTPLFTYDSLTSLVTQVVSVGGSKPRRLLRHQHHSNSPSQQKKRPKKRKTIKKGNKKRKISIIKSSIS
jgi:hypothetical protein